MAFEVRTDVGVLTIGIVGVIEELGDRGTNSGELAVVTELVTSGKRSTCVELTAKRSDNAIVLTLSTGDDEVIGMLELIKGSGTDSVGIISNISSEVETSIGIRDDEGACVCEGVLVENSVADCKGVESVRACGESVIVRSCEDNCDDVKVGISGVNRRGTVDWTFCIVIIEGSSVVC